MCEEKKNKEEKKSKLNKNDWVGWTERKLYREWKED